jgi:cytidine deaminase
VADDSELREAADRAASRAYAPYPGLKVGAALRSANGLIHCGCNVENGALPVGNCAERAAIAAAVLAEGPDFRLAAIAVVAIGGDGRPLPVPPCGACRQVLVEFGAGASVGFQSADGNWTEVSAEDLLPHRFVLPRR